MARGREAPRRKGGRRRAHTGAIAKERSGGKRQPLAGRPENEPVQARTFDLTKRSGWAGLGAGVAGAAWAIVTTLADQPTAVRVAGLAVLVAAVVGFAIVASSDILARARVTAAEFAVREPAEDEEEDDEDESLATLESVTPVDPRITLSIGNRDGPLHVLAIAWDPEKDELEYLAGRSGDRPDWVPQSEVTGVTYPAEAGDAIGAITAALGRLGAASH